MSNIQKAFKGKAKCGLRMATGGVLLSPGHDNDLTRANQMGGAADAMAANNNAPGAGAGFVSMDFDPQANLNSLSPNTGAVGNPFYGGQYGNDPKLSASTNMSLQRSSAMPGMPRRPAPNMMTPVDDLLPTRRGLADGGVIVDPVEALLARTKANYGVGNVPAPQVTSPVPPAPAPAPTPAQPSGGLFQQAVRGLRGRTEQIEKATNFADGAVVKVVGPGSGTSDDIPLGLHTNGKKIDVKVSNGEALAVLPAKTASDPQAVEAVNQIIETTNGRPPATRGLRAGGQYAAGIVDDPVERAAMNRARVPTAGLNPTQTVTATAPNMAPELQFVEEAAEKPGVVRQAVGRAKAAGETIKNAGERAMNYAKNIVKSPAAPELKWYQPSPGVKAAARMPGKLANAAMESKLAPIVTALYGTNEAAKGFQNQANRDASEIDERGGFLASSMKDAFPFISGVGQAIGDRTARMVTSLRGGLDPETGRNLSFSEALRSGPGMLGFITDNLETAGKPTAVAPTQSSVTAAKPVEPTPLGDAPGAMDRFDAAVRVAAANGQPTVNGDVPNAPPANDIKRSLRMVNGRPQVEFSGKDVKQTYTGADGKPTNNWYDTQDYKESQVRAQKDKELLRTLQRWNAQTSAASPNSYHQGVGLRQLAELDRQEQLATAKEVAAADRDIKRQGLDIQREDLGLRRAQEARALATSQRQAAKDAAEFDLRAKEAMDKDEEQARKIYAGHFLTKNDKGEMVEDKAALDDFFRRVNHSLLTEGAATKDPRLWDEKTSRPKSFANVDKATQDFLLNRYNAYRRWKQAQGWMPGYADKGDTMNLFDLNAREDGDYLVFDRLGKSRAQKKDFMFTTPVDTLDIAAMKTPDDTLYRNLLGK